MLNSSTTNPFITTPSKPKLPLRKKADAPDLFKVPKLTKKMKREIAAAQGTKRTRQEKGSLRCLEKPLKASKSLMSRFLKKPDAAPQIQRANPERLPRAIQFEPNDPRSLLALNRNTVIEVISSLDVLSFDAFKDKETKLFNERMKGYETPSALLRKQADKIDSLQTTDRFDTYDELETIIKTTKSIAYSYHALSKSILGHVSNVFESDEATFTATLKSGANTLRHIANTIEEADAQYQEQLIITKYHQHITQAIKECFYHNTPPPPQFGYASGPETSPKSLPKLWSEVHRQASREGLTLARPL